MEDVIAVEVHLDSGECRYFITWGRIQDTLDGTAVCELVLSRSRSFALGGQPVDARLCGSLRTAADSPEAPYFYEAFLSFASVTIPFGDGYRAWRAEKDAAMQDGREIYYCGNPGPEHR